MDEEICIEGRRKGKMGICHGVDAGAGIVVHEAVIPYCYLTPFFFLIVAEMNR